MPETPNMSAEQNLFSTAKITQVVDAPAMNTAAMGGGFWDTMTQNEKDAILRQIHPIFLTTHSEEKAPTLPQSNFDKFLNFLRLCLEGILKLADILVDAAVQISRLFVHVIAILWSLIVVTLMTNTTDKFIDILNSSIFPIFWIETKIQKVWPTTPILPLPTTQTNQQTTMVPTSDNNLKSSTTQTTETANTSTTKELSREEIIRMRREALQAKEAATTTTE